MTLQIPKPRVTMERIDSLEPYPGNPNRGDVDAIGDSVDANGWYGTVVVQTSTRRILAGHHRIQAATERGAARVPVVWADVDDAAARRIVVGDNQIPRNADTDDDALRALLDSIHGSDGGLLGTGYGETDYQALLRRLAGPAIEDEVPTVPTTPTTKTGDVITLGPHRLVCGDATDAESWEILLDGDRRDDCLTFTSPPYALGDAVHLRDQRMAGGVTRRSTRPAEHNAYASHDDGDPAAWARLMDAWTPLAHQHTAAQIVNVQMLAPNKRHLVAWLAAVADRLVDVAIWHKPQGGAAQMARHVLSNGYEFLVILADAGASRSIPFADFGYQPNVITTPHTRNPDNHAATMPILLADHVLNEWTSLAPIVVDPFAGTGTTMAACHHRQKACRMIEIDPAYCDVIRQRYEALT